MKTMTKAQFKNLIMSGYFPTLNEDIADMQDIFDYLPYWYHISLLVCDETRNAMKNFCSKLLDGKTYDQLLKAAGTQWEELNKKQDLERRIKEMEEELRKLRHSTSTVEAILGQIKSNNFEN